MKKLLILALFLLATLTFPCDDHFNSGHLDLLPGEVKSFDISLVGCDLLPDILHVYGYVTGHRKSRQIKSGDKIRMFYQSMNGDVLVSDTGWLTVENPTFTYTVTITNMRNKVQKLRLRAVALVE